MVERDAVSSRIRADIPCGASGGAGILPYVVFEGQKQAAVSSSQ